MKLKGDMHKKAITLHIFLPASIGLAHVVLCVGDTMSASQQERSSVLCPWPCMNE
jgi:hypothetical protein